MISNLEAVGTPLVMINLIAYPSPNLHILQSTAQAPLSSEFGYATTLSTRHQPSGDVSS